MFRHLLALGLLVQTGSILADTLAGRVSGVSDGAALTVVDSTGVPYKVRLAAIDAPESRQPYGKESKQSLSDLVLGKEVKVEWRKHDRYGRIVGKLTLQAPPCATCPKTLDAGLAQLEAGLAWWDKESRREQSLADQGYYEYAEFDAKTRRIGLWQDVAPMPPWEWRKKNQVMAYLVTDPVASVADRRKAPHQNHCAAGRRRRHKPARSTFPAYPTHAGLRPPRASRRRQRSGPT